MSINDFNASNGWLDKFRKRYMLSMKNLCGESAELDLEVVSNWKEYLPNLRRGYELKDIFNCDETGLFWRGVPTRSFVKQPEKAKGGKLAKERVTILLTSSATGEKWIH